MAVMDFTSSVSGIVKRVYTKQALIDLQLLDNPFLAFVNKEPSHGMGESIQQPIWYGDGSNSSADFSITQTNGDSPQVVQFGLKGKTIHGVIQISLDTVRATMNDEGRFVKAVEFASTNKLRELKNRIGELCWGDGTGLIGSFSAISSGVITLSDPFSVNKYQKNQILRAFATDGTTEVTAGALGYVVAKDVGAGTITVSATAGGSAGTPTNWSTSFPQLYQYGNYGTTAANKVFIGVGGFLPAVAPSSGDSFFGVDRSVDSGLSGLRFNAAGQDMRSALIKCVAQLHLNGSHVDTAWLNPMDWAALETSLQDQVRYVMGIKPEGASIGLTAMVLGTPHGDLKVFSDRSVPLSTAYALDMATWHLYSTGEIPCPATAVAGGELARIRDGSDQIEVRYAGQLIALGCSAPGFNARLSNFGK